MIIALVGNPNCGKTTLFNALTGSTQYVGNWPGVTVEKKLGVLRGNPRVTVADLPGIYSLEAASPDEKAARAFLEKERPDVILNIIDATNLERNLYLTTQLLELGIPLVLALNVMDMVEKKRGPDRYPAPFQRARLSGGSDGCFQGKGSPGGGGGRCKLRTAAGENPCRLSKRQNAWRKRRRPSSWRGGVSAGSERKRCRRCSS